jgi:hypothetical protein
VDVSTIPLNFPMNFLMKSGITTGPGHAAAARDLGQK